MYFMYIYMYVSYVFCRRIGWRYYTCFSNFAPIDDFDHWTCIMMNASDLYTNQLFYIIGFYIFTDGLDHVANIWFHGPYIQANKQFFWRSFFFHLFDWINDMLFLYQRATISLNFKEDACYCFTYSPECMADAFYYLAVSKFLMFYKIFGYRYSILLFSSNLLKPSKYLFLLYTVAKICDCCFFPFS